MIKLNPPFINVEETMPLVEKVLRSGTLTQGDMVHELEYLSAKMAGTSSAVAVSNATVGLELLLSKLGKPGDEVITTPFTFKATVNAILRAGRIPRLVDIGDDYLINQEQVLKSITEKTAAIIVVHLYGYPVNVKDLLAQTSVPIIEDASQAHGSRICGLPVGSQGSHASVFSFYGTKNIASGEGGVITTNNGALVDTLKQLRNHKKPTHVNAIPTNARMSELQAAVAIPQLKRVEQIADIRRSNAFYLSQFVDHAQTGDPDKYHNYHLFTIESDDATGLVRHFNKYNVEVGRYYRYPMESHFVTMAQCFPLDNMYKKAERVVSLPVHPGLRKEDLDDIGTILKSFEPKPVERIK